MECIFNTLKYQLNQIITHIDNIKRNMQGGIKPCMFLLWIWIISLIYFLSFSSKVQVIAWVVGISKASVPIAAGTV